MALTDVTQPAAQLTQVAAVVVGGGWAYMKFVRGRTFRYRAELEIEASLSTFRGEPVIKTQVSMKNEGLSQIDLQISEQKLVFVDALAERAWVPGANPAWEEDQPALVARLFRHHAWIEPGETVVEELLLPLALADSGPVVAYQVRAWVRATRPRRDVAETWTANVIVPAALEDRG